MTPLENLSHPAKGSRMSFVDLMKQTWLVNRTNPMEAVYAFRALIKEDDNIHVDYSISRIALFKTVMRACRTRVCFCFIIVLLNALGMIAIYGQDITIPESEKLEITSIPYIAISFPSPQTLSTMRTEKQSKRKACEACEACESSLLLPAIHYSGPDTAPICLQYACRLKWEYHNIVNPDRARLIESSWRPPKLFPDNPIIDSDSQHSGRASRITLSLQSLIDLANTGLMSVPQRLDQCQQQAGCMRVEYKLLE